MIRRARLGHPAAGGVIAVDDLIAREQRPVPERAPDRLHALDVGQRLVVVVDSGDQRAVAVERALEGVGLLADDADHAGVCVVFGGAVETRRLSEVMPHCRVVTVLGDGTRREVLEALEAGAHGVVAEADLEEVLIAVVHAVGAGLIVVPEAARHAARRPIFTVREKQILGLLVLGATNADIAARLFVSESTVKFHLTSVFHKLGVTCRKEAIEAILDPDQGLGTGILGLTGGRDVQLAYGTPSVSNPGAR